MTNVLLHRVEVIESTPVETIKQLQDAIGACQGPGKDDRNLAATYLVELLCETLSDGSEVFEVRIRPAERQI